MACISICSHFRPFKVQSDICSSLLVSRRICVTHSLVCAKRFSVKSAKVKALSSILFVKEKSPGEFNLFLTFLKIHRCIHFIMSDHNKEDQIRTTDYGRPVRAFF